jgi:hypothetical protein
MIINVGDLNAIIDDFFISSGNSIIGYTIFLRNIKSNTAWWERIVMNYDFNVLDQ